MAKKISYNLICPYCEKECKAGKDEFTLTRRKTMQYFHKACYEANTRRVKNESVKN